MRPLNPVQKFAVLSSIFVTGLCLGLAFTIAYLLEHHMREGEWLSTAAFVTHQVEEHNLAPYFTEPRLRREPAKYQEVFKHLSTLPEIVRIKVWDREATVLWTDDERLIGRRFHENPELKQALAGRLSVELKTLRKADNVLERERFTRLAEIYVPIPSKSSGEIVGVVEVYMLPARLFAGIQRMRALVWGIVISGGILLYGGLLPIVRRSYRKQFELEGSLREYSQHLEKISRHKSEFLANMSHELRTPLNSVLGFSELLAQQTYGPLTEKQSRYVENIHKSGRQLLALISDLLDLSKVEAGKVELHLVPFDLREAVKAALHDLRPQADAKSLAFKLHVDSDLPMVTADPIRVMQVLHNLLSNAVKFTPAAGQITVAVRRLQTTQPTVHAAETSDGELSTVNCKQPGEFVEISVQDTGIGIKSEDVPRLFKPFTQLEPALTKNYGGTGLGLALTKKLVELHGGTIWAESVGEGKGSTFRVRLPAAESRDTPRLLVVDDDETLLGTIRDALKTAGYHVETAADGAVALAQVEVARPDLVILDLSLPQVNGWEVLRSLRADTGTRVLPVLVITGVEVGRGDEILTAGADEFLAKPFSVPVLVSTVQRLLEQGPLADRVLGWQTLARTP